MQKKTIVISAVNLIEAGTLVILKDCLNNLSELAAQGEYRIIAIVYKKELAYFPNIEYIETQWPKKRWINRLWYEYVSLRNISKKLSPVYLWFSLHDTTPTVFAERRAVYCHNTYFFYKWKLHDIFFAPKIALFAIFTKYIYKINISKNRYLVVQQNWFKHAMSEVFSFDKKAIIVAKPNNDNRVSQTSNHKLELSSFVFAGSPNSHKNFEVICRAAAILENKGIDNFKIYLTVSGQENKYAKWLFNNWGNLKSIVFIGFQTQNELFDIYNKCCCLLFPSKVESWGLPISEFANYDKPMLLADLPYAHETAAGAKYVDFFNPESSEELANKMEKIINKNFSSLRKQPLINYDEPYANNWKELFSILLTDNK